MLGGLRIQQAKAGVEIDVVERSPNRFVPTVMCRQGADCTSILNAFNAMFSFEQTDA